MEDAEHRLSLILLGPVQARRGSTPITGFRSRKAMALLVYLAVSGTAQPRETLAGLLWPDLPDAHARASLSQALTNLRQLIGKALVTTRNTVALAPGSIELDATTFAAALQPLTTPGGARQPTAEALQIAITAFQGDFLAGFSLADAPAFEEWATIQREQYRRLAVLGLHALADRQLVEGAHAPAITALRRILTLEPWREEAHRQLMTVLAESGQRSAALAQYELCRRHLVDELEAEPSAETTALYERIKTAVGSGRVGLVQPAPVPAPPYTDWEEAPDPGRFYGRRSEINLLEGWLLTERCRVIVIVGIGGVGKTTLAAALARSLAGHFDGVIWRSVLNAPPPGEVLHEWLQVLARFASATDRPAAHGLPVALDQQLNRLVEGLRQRRWLLVLDNLESTLGSGASTGAFRSGYAAYGQLIEHLGRHEHTSCLLITSRERPPELSRLEASGLPVQILELIGLSDEAGRDILRERELSGSTDDEAAFVERYSGNPLALRLAAQTVQELFAGDIAAFLGEGTPIFDDIRAVLDQQIARLSPLEVEIVSWLAIEREPVSLKTIGDNLVQPEARATLLEAVRSLRRRSLLEQRGGALTLQNVVTEYLTDRLVLTAGEELVSAQPDRLHRYALLKAEAKEYLRLSQVRLILEPIAARAVARLGQHGLAATVRRLLDDERRQPRVASYLAGNLLNLLLHLELDLSGLDLSQLCVWQAYLRGMTLPAVNLTGADLHGSAFSDDFRAITTIAFSPDGQLMAAGTNDGAVRCWRTSDWQPVTVCTGHSRPVRSVTFSPDGRLLASAGSDGQTCLWEAATGRLCRRLEAGRGQAMSVAFTPDGAVLVCAYWDQAIIFWELATGQPQHRLDEPIGITESIAISPDGRLLASGGWDGEIRLWDCASGALRHAWAGHERVIKMVAFSPDGQTLGSCSWDETIALWEVSTGQQRRRLLGHECAMASLAFSRDGSLVAGCGWSRVVRVWDVQTGQILHCLDGHTSWVEALAFGPDATTLASGGWDQSIRFWSEPSGRAVRALHGFSSRVSSVTFSPDGAMLASSYHDRLVRLWSVASGRQLATMAGHHDALHDVAFSPDGRLLASAGHDHEVRLWETASARPLAVLRGHTDAVLAVAFAPDGQTVISAGRDQTVRLWTVATGQEQAILRGHTAHLDTVAVSPDGCLLASGGHEPIVCLWAMATGQLIQQWSSDAQWTKVLRFSPDGSLLATGGHDRAVKLYTVTGELVELVDLAFPTAGSLVALAFSPDGRLLAAGDNAKLIYIWEVASARLLHQLAGHENSVEALSFSPDGSLLASCSHDETVRLWEVETGAGQRLLRVAKPYAGTIITGVTGITEAQRLALVALGAVDADQGGADQSSFSRPWAD